MLVAHGESDHSGGRPSHLEKARDLPARYSWILAQETVREGRRPERTVYQLTGAGTRELNEWLSELVSVPVREFPQFMAALSFLGALPPEEAQETLSQRAQALEIRLAQNRSGLQAAAGARLARLVWLEAEYENKLLEAELDFVRALVKDIDDGSLEGIELCARLNPKAPATA